MQISLVTAFVSISVLAAAQNSLPNGKDWILFGPSHTSSTLAPAGTTGITYHGGPIMGDSFAGDSPINIYYIWYGNWASLDSTAQTILQTLAGNIGGSPYFNINTTY